MSENLLKTGFDVDHHILSAATQFDSRPWPTVSGVCDKRGFKYTTYQGQEWQKVM